jgi:hypothetical protein
VSELASRSAVVPERFEFRERLALRAGSEEQVLFAPLVRFAAEMR